MTISRWAGVNRSENRMVIGTWWKKSSNIRKEPLLMEKKTKKALRGKKGRKLHETESQEKPLGERNGKKFLKEERMASLIEGD